MRIPRYQDGQTEAVARARGVPVGLLVEEALRCIVAPEPFASEAEAAAEIEALQADVLKDHPWEA
jgi:hypothetical protein